MPDQVSSLQTNTLLVDGWLVGETETNISTESFTFILQTFWVRLSFIVDMTSFSLFSGASPTIVLGKKTWDVVCRSWNLKLLRSIIHFLVHIKCSSFSSPFFVATSQKTRADGVIVTGNYLNKFSSHFAGGIQGKQDKKMYKWHVDLEGGHRRSETLRHSLYNFALCFLISHKTFRNASLDIVKHRRAGLVPGWLTTREHPVLQATLGAQDTWRSRDLRSTECASLTTRLHNSPLRIGHRLRWRSDIWRTDRGVAEIRSPGIRPATDDDIRHNAPGLLETVDQPLRTKVRRKLLNQDKPSRLASYALQQLTWQQRTALAYRHLPTTSRCMHLLSPRPQLVIASHPSLGDWNHVWTTVGWKLIQERLS